MAYASLISTEYLFIFSGSIDKNIDPDLLNPYITIAQDVDIQEIIGYNLYQSIMGKVADNSIELPANINYKTLLANFIQPALVQWTIYESLPFIQWRFTNKSIVTKTAENTASTGMEEVVYLRNSVKHIANNYNQRIREYILNNQTFFPEYFISDGSDRIKPSRTTYFSGWSGPSTRGYNDECC